MLIEVNAAKLSPVSSADDAGETRPLCFFCPLLGWVS